MLSDRASDGDGQGAGAARRLTTIVSADVCGYTALSEADPSGALASVETLTSLVSGITERHGGRLFHRAGDGFLCELPSATAGVAAARDIQLALKATPVMAAGRETLLRIGVHTGEATVEASGDLLGHAVNVAARLQGEAQPAGIVVSAAVATHYEGDVPLRRMGDLKLKNLRQPITAFEVIDTTGIGARLKALTSTAWMRRNRTMLAGLAAITVILVIGSLGWSVRTARLAEAERREAARLETVKEEAAQLAASLTADEARMLGRDEVEKAALSLLTSTDPRKRDAREAAIAGDALRAAVSLKAVYAADADAEAERHVLAETAVQCGALAFRQNQDLAGWCYERAYEAMPREPFVLLRLAEIALDRGDRDDARSYLSALLATGPEPRYSVEAERLLADIALFDRRYDAAGARLREALAVARAANLTAQEASLLAELGGLSVFRSSLAPEDSDERSAFVEEAEGHLARSLRVFRALRDAEGVATVLARQGQAAQLNGDFSRARSIYEERLALAQDAGDQASIASVAFNLAEVCLMLDDPAGRDGYLALAFEAALEGRVDGMLPYLHLAAASYAALDGEEERACLALKQAEDAAMPEDKGFAEMRKNKLAALTCQG